MEIRRALKIAMREWENIRVSLEEYGDSGGFNQKNYLDNRLALLPGGITLARKLIEMEDKLRPMDILHKKPLMFSQLSLHALQRELDLRVGWLKALVEDIVWYGQDVLTLVIWRRGT
jgi:hypothetical protein